MEIPIATGSRNDVWDGAAPERAGKALVVMDMTVEHGVGYAPGYLYDLMHIEQSSQPLYINFFLEPSSVRTRAAEEHV